MTSVRWIHKYSVKSNNIVRSTLEGPAFGLNSNTVVHWRYGILVGIESDKYGVDFALVEHDGKIEKIIYSNIQVVK